MLGTSAPYEIAKVKSYNLDEAIKELYKGSPSTTYGIRYKIKGDYHKI